MSQLSIIGITRFSVDPGAIISAGTGRVAELRRAIYSPDRLNTKFKLFTSFAFPSMAAAAKRYRNFHYVVLISPQLPWQWKARLWRLALTNRRWFRIAVLGAGEDVGDAAERVMGKLSPGTRIFGFRLDDDDALCPSFTDAVLAESAHSPNGMVLSFDHGFYIQRADTDMYFYRKHIYPKIAIGLGMFSAPDGVESIYRLNPHTKIPDERVVHITNRPFWLRTLHYHNDSGTRTSKQTSVSFSDACKAVAKNFPYLPVEKALLALPQTAVEDQDALRALFHIQ